MTLRPWWFPEYNPGQQMIFDQIFEIIQKNYKQYWYTHIQTPAVEANKVLMSKNWEDAGKQIFWLYWLAQWSEDTKDYSLHFDLTVPFARYILDRENEITFPFKRYQIQPAWRGERSQRGRFKELRQADIDVIRNDSNPWDIWKNLFYDSETLFVILKTLEAIKDRFLPWRKITMHINNRYLLSWFFSQFKSLDIQAMYSLVDKYYKIWQSKFEEELKTFNLSNLDYKKVIQFTQTKLQDLSIDLANNDVFNRGLKEIQEVMANINLLNQSDWFSFVYDPFIIRWLDYYTGTVYETFFEDDMWLGSISSWWRYENLTWYIDSKKNFYSWVWWSIGLSRMVYLILETFKPEQNTVADYLFLNFDWTFSDIIVLANTFVKNWKNIEIYPDADKLWKQFGSADKKWIPYVVILWEGEKKEWIYKIKNMKTGEEELVKL